MRHATPGLGHHKILEPTYTRRRLAAGVEKVLDPQPSARIAGSGWMLIWHFKRRPIKSRAPPTHYNMRKFPTRQGRSRLCREGWFR